MPSGGAPPCRADPLVAMPSCNRYAIRDTGARLASQQKAERERLVSEMPAVIAARACLL